MKQKKTNWFLIGGIALAAIAAVLIVSSAYQSQRPASLSSNHQATHDHSTTITAKAMPAHFEVPPSKSSLGPTLDPETFSGPVRDAYRAAKEIPVTIAQLPCYCHCDQSFGHKSLYSCYQSDHAAHCAVCVQEALLALRMERDQKMTPAQIRDAIVAQYSQ